jgi:hypothetical protein
MEPSDLSRLAAQVDGVTERRQDGLLCWGDHGRLLANSTTPML